MVGLPKLVNKVDAKTRAATQTHRVIIYWYYGYYQNNTKQQGLNSHRSKEKAQMRLYLEDCEQYSPIVRFQKLQNPPHIIKIIITNNKL